MLAASSVVGCLLLATLTGAAHECERPCVAGDTRACLYQFRLQEYHTMGRACFDCPDNFSDCLREECVAADGVPRPLLAVNRQLPGPDIQVCQGDSVVVDVVNQFMSDTEVLHWHGQHMRGQQYYDGVPFLTQCPQMTGVFRYNFTADTVGTHFWHSHIGLHRGSGVIGALVVRQADDPHLGTYDVDDPAHVLVLHDWTHVSAMEKFLINYQYLGDDYASTILVNGRGTNSAADLEGVTAAVVPLEVVQVTQGLRYRIRIIGATSLNVPLVVSVDSHRFTIVATDGDPIVPFTADSFVLYTGERFDIILEANQPVDNYWIRFNALIDGSQNECVQGAVLRYEGAPVQDPSSPLTYDPNYPAGVVVNPVNYGGGDPNLIMVTELEALVPAALQETVDKQFVLAFNFHRVNNTKLYNPSLYPYNAVDEKWQSNTPQLNGISFQLPASPPLSQPNDPQPTVCLYGQSPVCEGDYCSCTYVLEAALGDTVELMMVDEGTLSDSNHPFHLHGHNLYVVAMDRLGSNTTAAEVVAEDQAGNITRKLVGAPRKDTVTIPDGGYTIVRFTTDNPGWWLLHCHLSYHSEMGMMAALHVGTPADVPPVPSGFPTCGSFTPGL